MGGAEDLFRLLAGRASGGGQLLDAARLRDALDELRKGMTGLEDVERRMANIEQRLAAVEVRLDNLARPLASTSRAKVNRPSRRDSPEF